MLMCCAGVQVAVLMSWQERLSSLRTLGCHEMALSAGLSIFAAAQLDQLPASQIDTPDANSHQPAQANAPWPAEGGGANLAAVSQALTSLLKGHVAAVLDDGSAEQGAQVQSIITLTYTPSKTFWHVCFPALPGSAEPSSRIIRLTGVLMTQDTAGSAADAADAAADLALGLCVLLHAPDVLWTDVFPRFQEAGQSTTFLQRLQPRILDGQLPSPAPEVVQVSCVDAALQRHLLDALS